MDLEVARVLIAKELERLKKYPYEELLKLLDKPSTTASQELDGKTYQTEIQAFWGSKAGGNLSNGFYRRWRVQRLQAGDRRFHHFA